MSKLDLVSSLYSAAAAYRCEGIRVGYYEEITTPAAEASAALRSVFEDAVRRYCRARAPFFGHPPAHQLWLATRERLEPLIDAPDDILSWDGNAFGAFLRDLRSLRSMGLTKRTAEKEVS